MEGGGGWGPWGWVCTRTRPLGVRARHRVMTVRRGVGRNGGGGCKRLPLASLVSVTVTVTVRKDHQLAQDGQHPSEKLVLAAIKSTRRSALVSRRVHVVRGDARAGSNRGEPPVLLELRDGVGPHGRGGQLVAPRLSRETQTYSGGDAASRSRRRAASGLASASRSARRRRAAPSGLPWSAAHRRRSSAPSASDGCFAPNSFVS